MTRLIEYRDDGLVQIHKDIGGFVPPIKNAIVVHFDGWNHYEAVELNGNCQYSPNTVPIERSDVQKKTFQRMQFRLKRKLMKRSKVVDFYNDSSSESNSTPRKKKSTKPADFVDLYNESSSEDRKSYNKGGEGELLEDKKMSPRECCSVRWDGTVTIMTLKL
jgi:hypothetical protein